MRFKQVQNPSVRSTLISEGNDEQDMPTSSRGSGAPSGRDFPAGVDCVFVAGSIRGANEGELFKKCHEQQHVICKTSMEGLYSAFPLGWLQSNVTRFHYRLLLDMNQNSEPFEGLELVDMRKV
jgi:hypothetical protein